LSEESLLAEIGVLKPSNNLENEIQILTSRTLMNEVMEKLGINVAYIGQGRFKDTDFYTKSPIFLDSVHWGSPRRYATLEIEPLEQDRFRLIQETQTTEHDLSAPLILNQDTFWLRTNPYVNKGSVLKIIIGLGPGRYLGNLSIKPMGEFSSVLNLQIQDPIPQRAADVINTLIDVYNQAAIDDKTQVAKKTQIFIDERLQLLTRELSAVEGGLETYKEQNELPAETSAAVSFAMNEMAGYKKSLTEYQIQLELLKSVEALLRDDVEQYELIPSNIVVQSGGLTSQIGSYNTLLLQRQRLQTSAEGDNPTLIALNEELARLRQNIMESLTAVRRNIELTIRETEQQLAEVQNRINQVPRQERELLEIKRQQNIKEALYLYLLQKREETALSAAIAVPNARIIDPAQPSGPISPVPLRIYAFGIFIGMAVPIGLLFLRELLDDKVYSESDIKAVTQVPLIGTISQNKTSDPIVIKPGSRSGISESFRMLRTNLKYMAQGDGQQTVLVTSGTGGDGKTFLSINLGISLSLTGKKVVLLGMDLRKPRLSQYLTQQSDYTGEGITNYLVGDIPVDTILRPTTINDNLFFIPSGPIPPNPAELLGSPRLRMLFDELKHRFDYIVLDTAPVGLVTDAFLLESFTDISLFAVRYAKTPRPILQKLEEIRLGGKLSKPAIVLNGVKPGKGYGYSYGYGYGYGYGYYEDQTRKRRWKWWPGK
jgi:capsular exopolysaccharide synthesis family protein